VKYSQLVALLKARYRAAGELGDELPNKQSEDFSI
jgi:hypothetical protein